MICFQKIDGFHALNHQTIENSWDVTPVTDWLTYGKWKVVLYSVWAESAIICLILSLFGEIISNLSDKASADVAMRNNSEHVWHWLTNHSLSTLTLILHLKSEYEVGNWAPSLVFFSILEYEGDKPLGPCLVNYQTRLSLHLHWAFCISHHHIHR